MDDILHKAFIGIGTNIGDREKNIRQALAKIEEAGIKIIKKSSIVETKPYGLTSQPLFLNCVVEVETKLNAAELLKKLLEIELLLGRERKIHWGPRIIDLDILFFDNLIIETNELKVPHPDMHNRIFVLEPLAQIAPDYNHPAFNKKIKELLNDLKRRK